MPPHPAHQIVNMQKVNRQLRGAHELISTGKEFHVRLESARPGPSTVVLVLSYDSTRVSSDHPVSATQRERLRAARSILRTETRLFRKLGIGSQRQSD